MDQSTPIRYRARAYHILPPTETARATTSPEAAAAGLDWARFVHGGLYIICVTHRLGRRHVPVGLVPDAHSATPRLQPSNIIRSL